MRFRPLSLLVCLLPTSLLGQGAPSPAPAIDFSGTLFGNLQYRTDSAAKFSTGGKPSNKFDIARAYLNFRMPAGERASIRITTDVYQQTGAAAAYYAGWAIRLKYAYLQYDAAKNIGGVDGLNMLARIGMLHNVVIEHVDSHWPRYLGINDLETHGFFASADVGAATLVTLPSRRGEVYATIVNGSNYSAADPDRFKDFAARTSFTPFAADSGFLRTLAITPWYSKGWSASQFVTGGGAQVGPVPDGLQKDRRGVFVGVRDRRLTTGLQWAQRLEDVEAGANTLVSPRTVASRTRTLQSGFAFLRPLELADPKKRSRFSLFGRFDRFDNANVVDAVNELAWFGALWDLTARTTLTLDYQELKAKSGSTTIPTKTLFMHWVANF